MDVGHVPGTEDAPPIVWARQGEGIKARKMIRRNYSVGGFISNVRKGSSSFGWGTAGATDREMHKE
jgi:hypothetical protein